LPDHSVWQPRGKPERKPATAHRYNHPYFGAAYRLPPLPSVRLAYGMGDLRMGLGEAAAADVIGKRGSPPASKRRGAPGRGEEHALEGR
jgi:hypothetical protein